MADIFSVVADPTRRELLTALRDGGELSVGELVDRLGLTQPTVSKHLRVLRDAGLVTVREDGAHRRYRLEPWPLDELHGWLAPFVTAPPADDEAGVTVYRAWAGVEVGTALGRRVAERRHQARGAVGEASRAMCRRMPRWLRRRPRD